MSIRLITLDAIVRQTKHFSAYFKNTFWFKISSGQFPFKRHQVKLSISKIIIECQLLFPLNPLKWMALKRFELFPQILFIRDCYKKNVKSTKLNDFFRISFYFVSPNAERSIKFIMNQNSILKLNFGFRPVQ